MNATHLPRIQLAKLRLRLDRQRPGVSSLIGRTHLEEIDRRRNVAVFGTDAGLTFYLMAPLTAPDDEVPDDAIGLIKALLGRAFRRETTAAKTLKQLWSTRNNRAHIWAVFEANGAQLSVRPAQPALAKEFLTPDFDFTRHLDVRAFPQHAPSLRLLVEVVGDPAVPAEDDWARLVDQLKGFADADADPPAEPIDPVGALKNWILTEHTLGADDAARCLHARAADAASWASRKRKAGELFGVWSSARRTFVHPDFQFGDQLTDEIRKAIFKLLWTRVGFDPVHEDKGGWARAFWLYQPNSKLSRRALDAPPVDPEDPVTSALLHNFLDDTPRAPAEVFATHWDAVIDLAEELEPREIARG